MEKAIIETNFRLPRLKERYVGKVRDVYHLDGGYLVMVVTDRISAFDIVLPKGVPFKGQVLNQIASVFLDATSGIVPNWKIESPDPMVTAGYFAEPFKVEMVIRGYLTGHVWREYKSGKREICGVPLPDGMREHEKFPEPLITPTTKATEGHDEDISKEEIISTGLVTKEDYEKLEHYTYALFEKGTQMAAEKGLILVDTKYEFGKRDGQIMLIDEVHTPDSSRYFYSEGYEERLEKGESQRQLSKEFVREWLIDKGFSGKDGEKIPAIPDQFIESVSERYIELYEKITGNKFSKAKSDDVTGRIEENIKGFVDRL